MAVILINFFNALSFFLILTVNGWAQVECEDDSLFCNDPVTFICSKRPSSFYLEEQRKVYLMAKQAMEKTSIPEGVNHQTYLSSIKLGFDSVRFPKKGLLYDSWIEYVKNLYTSYMSEWSRPPEQKMGIGKPLNEFDLQKGMEKLSWQDVEHLLDKIKLALKQAISSSSFDDEQKLKISNRLDEIKLFTSKDISSSEESKKLMNLFHLGCSESGLEKNMYFIPKEEGVGRYVLLCPRAFENVKNAADLEKKLSFILAHEMAHDFDYQKEEKLYTDFEQCLRSKHIPPSSMPGWLDSFVQYHLEGLVTDYFSTGKLSEATSDAWATQVLSIMMADIPENEREDFLSHNLYSLCDGVDQEYLPKAIGPHYAIHPTSRFRMDNLIGTNELIRSYVGCPQAQSKACSL